MTPEQVEALKGQMEKDPKIGLIIGATVGAMMPHIALTTLLLEKGLITKAELSVAYDKHLDASKYLKGLAEMLAPMWDSLKKGVQ